MTVFSSPRYEVGTVAVCRDVTGQLDRDEHARERARWDTGVDMRLVWPGRSQDVVYFLESDCRRLLECEFRRLLSAAGHRSGVQGLRHRGDGGDASPSIMKGRWEYPPQII